MGDLKLAGINSGFDTEAMITQLMSSYQSKIDNQNKKLTMLTWQQEAFRDVISKISAFQSKYFDILNKGSYLLTPSNFQKFTTTITNKTNPASTFSGVKVVTGANSVVGSHSLKVSQTASAAKLTGASLATANFNLDLEQAANASHYEEITEERELYGDDGALLTDEEGNPVTESVVIGRSYSFSLNVKVGDISKTIDFSFDVDCFENGELNMEDFTDKITESLNEKLADTFGMTGRNTSKNNVTGAVDEDGNEYFLQVKKGDGNKLEFAVGGNAAVTVTEKEGTFGLGRLAYRIQVDASSTVTGKNGVAVTVNGITKNVTFDGISEEYFDTRNNAGNEKILEEFNALKEASYRAKRGLSDDEAIDQDALDSYTYTSAMAAKDKNTNALNEALNKEFADEGLTWTIDRVGNVTVVDSEGADQRFTLTSTEGGTLGITKNSASSKVSNEAILSDLGFMGPQDDDLLIVNGKLVNIKGYNTMDEICDAVNKSGAGVTMTYSKLENRFIVTANDMGSSGKVSFMGELAKQLGLTAGSTYEEGKNAIFEIDGVELVQSSNSYTLDDGTQIDFSDVPEANWGNEFTIGLEKDYTDIKQILRDFVNDYNQLIDDVYNHIGTQRSRDSKNNLYDPLTDAQKEEMTEKEIEKWEAEAMKGVIYNDPTISSIMSQLRATLYSSITMEDGTKFSLQSMGITTVASIAKGTSSIDKTKYADSLRGKIEIDDEKFEAAFANNIEAIEKLITDTKTGVMAKVDNILKNAVSTTGATKGSLIRKAGLKGDNSDKDNTIYRQMQEINKRISTLQDRYDNKQKYWWDIFTRLETMMADFNSQSAYMANMFTNYLNNGSQQ